MAGKPLLIVANKQDLIGCLDGAEVERRLQLDTLLGENRASSSVVSVRGWGARETMLHTDNMARGADWKFFNINFTYV